MMVSLKSKLKKLNPIRRFKNRRKVIGKGGFGVISTPNYKCEDFKKKSKDYVSKSLKYTDIYGFKFSDLVLNNEIRMLKKIKKINKGNSSLMTHISMCKHPKKQYYYNIIFEKHGKSLGDYQKIELNKKEIKSNILKLIKSLKLLHKNKIYHRDLHTLNVLFDGKTMKINDFGISIDDKTIEKLLKKKYKTKEEYNDTISFIMAYPIEDHLYYKKNQPIFYKKSEEIEEMDIKEINELMKNNIKNIKSDIKILSNICKSLDIDGLITIIMKILTLSDKNNKLIKKLNGLPANVSLSELEKIIRNEY
jgi:serine/threonine protein kinase